jgi:hypothetical protein
LASSISSGRGTDRVRLSFGRITAADTRRIRRDASAIAGRARRGGESRLSLTDAKAEESVSAPR